MGYLEDIYNKSPIFLQTFVLNTKALELYLERYGRKFWKLFNEFDKNQRLSDSEIAAYQDEKLRVLVKYAYQKVPYYNRIMKGLRVYPEDIKAVNDLHKLPLLTKDDIRVNYKQLISSDFKWVFLRHGHTSGTTGSPLDICYDIKTCVMHQVADWRQKIWAGMEYGQPYASLQGRVIVPIHQARPPFWRMNHINKQLFLSSFHLTEKNIPFYFGKLEEAGIKAIEGYPSTIYILALYLIKHRATFPIKTVLTSSETLFDYQRDAIEKAFSCKIFDFYGMAERVVFATECDHHEGHHLNQDYGITEFLNSNNEPVERGKLGRIVATSLHNLAMPLIRYVTNDSSSLKEKICSCGRAFPLMDEVATKNESIITLPDGRLISPSILTHPFKPMRTIVESQIIQQECDQLVIRVVRAVNYSAEDERRLIKAFHERLGSEINVNIEYVDFIERSESGKFRWVISKIKPEF